MTVVSRRNWWRKCHSRSAPKQHILFCEWLGQKSTNLDDFQYTGCHRHITPAAERTTQEWRSVVVPFWRGRSCRVPSACAQETVEPTRRGPDECWAGSDLAVSNHTHTTTTTTVEVVVVVVIIVVGRRTVESMSTWWGHDECWVGSDLAVSKHIHNNNNNNSSSSSTTGVSWPTALGALCAQLTFPLACCRQHSAVMWRRNFCSCRTSPVELSSSPAA